MTEEDYNHHGTLVRYDVLRQETVDWVAFLSNPPDRMPPSEETWIRRNLPWWVCRPIEMVAYPVAILITGLIFALAGHANKKSLEEKDDE